MLDNTSTIDGTEYGYSEFLTAVEGCVRSKMDDSFEIKVLKTVKNNSTELDAISIRDNGFSVAPLIYLNEYYPKYRKGASIEEISDYIVDTYYHCMEGVAPDFDMNLDYEAIRHKIFLKLINYELNKTSLENMPYIRYRDLAVTFHVAVDINEQYNGSFKVSYDLCRMWGKETSDLLEDALVNTPGYFPYEFMPLYDIIEKIFADKIKNASDLEPDDELCKKMIDQLAKEMGIIKAMGHTPKMYVLSTGKAMGGAAALVYPGVLARIREELGEDFYIIPSSINEVIVLPHSIGCPDYINRMINEVNSTAVPEGEVLSDHVYSYPEDDFDLSKPED